MTDHNPPEPPRGLHKAARRWFDDMMQEYSFSDDPLGVATLGRAAEQLSRILEYRAAIKRDGLICRDRFDQPKEHPGAVGERAAANAFRLLCRELGLEPNAAADEKPRLPRLHGRAG